MKKILVFILSIVMLFTITGCGNNNSSSPENNSNGTTKNEDVFKLKIDNIDVELNSSSSFNNLSYKYPSKGIYSSFGTYVIIDLMNSSDLLVRVAMSYYQGKTIGDVIKGSDLSSVDAKTFNNNTWNIYKGKQNDGKNILNYITVDNGDAYSIAFISDKDINDFINSFMNNVKFK